MRAPLSACGTRLRAAADSADGRRRRALCLADWGFGALRRLRHTRPNLIHAVGPGFFMIPSIIYARLLKIPLVISYHTHLPHYAGKYAGNLRVPGLSFLAVKIAGAWRVVERGTIALLLLAPAATAAAQVSRGRSLA